MTARDVVQLAIPILILVGIVVSIYGTFLLTRWYHPFAPLGFLRTVSKALWLTVTGSVHKVESRTLVATKLGQITEEQKATSLIGIYWIFIGFVLQMFGTALQAGDTLYGIHHPTPPAQVQPAPATPPKISSQPVESR